jgi:glutamine synthetase
MDTAMPLEPAHDQLVAKLQAEGVQYALGTYVDVLGRAKSKVVPIDHLPNLLAGSERYTPRGVGGLGEMNASEDECVAMPDPTTLTVLPWDKRFAWMAADLLYGGTDFWPHCPRSILKRQLAIAADRGFVFNLGVETELYCYDPVATTGEYLEPMAPSGKIRPTPAYDAESTFDAMSFLDPMVRYMTEAGFGVFSFDHEGGDAQFEFDFNYAPALEMCDRLVLFRMMAKQVAKAAGLAVTFMPKPYTAAWGSGAHFNMSLVDADTGDNMFRDAGDRLGWSKTAYCFVAGVLRHARAIAAIATPTVNSYKRLAPRLADGTISWSPVWVAYGDNNRSCMLRLPRNRPAIEDRAVDAAANQYLTAAFILAAGLEGIELGLDPGDPAGEELFEPKAQQGATRLPRTLIEAVDAFEADPLTYEVFPQPFVSAYIEMKAAEWFEYHAQVTDWERDQYLTRF